MDEEMLAYLFDEYYEEPSASAMSIIDAAEAQQQAQLQAEA